MPPPVSPSPTESVAVDSAKRADVHDVVSNRFLVRRWPRRTESEMGASQTETTGANEST